MLLACVIARARLFSVLWALRRASKTELWLCPALFCFNHRAGSGKQTKIKFSEMNAQEKSQFLCIPIQQLELSAELKRAANANGIKTLQQILRYSTSEVERWPGFNIQLVHEYVSFLEMKGLGVLVDHF